MSLGELRNNNPKSGIVGITWHSGKWQVKYKQRYVGVYKNIDEAKKALEDYKNSIS